MMKWRDDNEEEERNDKREMKEIYWKERNQWRNVWYRRQWNVVMKKESEENTMNERKQQ